MAPPKKDPRKRIITGECTISFPRLYVPELSPGDNPTLKYSGAFVFDKESDLKNCKDAANVAGIEFFGREEFARLLKMPSFKIPFHGGEEAKAKGYPEGSVYFNATSKYKPGVIGPDKSIIDDPETVYAGCRVKASVTAFAFDNKSKGLSFALNNVQFLKDGPRLDSRVAAEDEFDEEMSGEPASLSDVLPEDAQELL